MAPIDDKDLERWVERKFDEANEGYDLAEMIADESGILDFSKLQEAYDIMIDNFMVYIRKDIPKQKG